MAIGGATRVVILGAAGRDFHNFNVVYRDDPTVTVVAFTATQIPGIAGRHYPASLAGPRYPDGIAIEDESELEALCRRERVTQVVFAYSDIPHATVMHAGSRALACRRRFRPARSGSHDADRPDPRDRHLRDPHRMRQVAGRPLARGPAAREDGPTITHGGMPHGAGYVAAVAAGATIVDPRVSADPAMRAVFAQYPHIGKVVPAIGYDAGQLAALRVTLNRADADVVVSATPLDLTALVALDKPVVRARYEFADAGNPTLGALVDRFLARGEGRRAV